MGGYMRSTSSWCSWILTKLLVIKNSNTLTMFESLIPDAEQSEDPTFLYRKEQRVTSAITTSELNFFLETGKCAEPLNVWLNKNAKDYDINETLNYHNSGLNQWTPIMLIHLPYLKRSLGLLSNVQIYHSLYGQGFIQNTH